MEAEVEVVVDRGRNLEEEFAGMDVEMSAALKRWVVVGVC